MWVIRPVRVEDTHSVLKLAASLGPGMTTFPADQDTIARKVNESVGSFEGSLKGAKAQYLMVLEDSKTKQILGVSAVYPEIGKPLGFFSYHIDRVIHHSAVTDYNLDVKVLNLSNAYTGMTEIGTLAVSPDLRRGGAGKMLARARYMLIASFPSNFAEHVIAEMRGWQNEDGSSPFWSDVGERFFQVDFPSADKMSAVQGAEWFASLLPKNPLYCALLSKEAQDCVGKAHETSAIAMRMLMKEGFKFENFIDIFDAGPQVIARRDEIKTVRDSTELSLALDCEPENEHEFLICNDHLEGFRLVRAKAKITNETISVDSQTRSLLNASLGDKLRCVLA